MDARDREKASTVVLVLAFALAGGACTRQPTTIGTAETEGRAVWLTACPNTVAGTLMRLDDTRDGIAITYTTTTDAVEVRRRAAALAERIARRSGHPRGVDASVRVGEVPMGARILIAPVDRAEREALRAQVRAEELPMREGDCSG